MSSTLVDDDAPVLCDIRSTPASQLTHNIRTGCLEAHDPEMY